MAPPTGGTELSTRDVATAADDPVVRAATPVIGGPIGRYAKVGSSLPWQPAATALSFVGSLMIAGGVLQKGHCVANGWGVPDVFWRACYSDLPFLFSSTSLAQGDFPLGRGSSLGQPPLTGALMWLVSLLVPAGDAATRQRWFFVLWAVVLVAVLALLVRATARSATRNPWRAVHVAASPLILTTALVSPDLFGVMLASYGLLLWGRNHPEWAGLLFGLAIAARTYPVLLVLVIGILAARGGRLRDWAGMAGTALISYVGTMVVLLGVGWVTGALRGLGDIEALLAPYRQWAAGGPDYGSIWYLPRAAGVTITPGAAVSVAAVGWVVALLVGALVALSAPRRPMIAEISLIVVGIVLITGRSLPVQASLWLIPLVALAGLRWRDHLIWASGEVCYFVAIWLYLGGQSDTAKGLPLPWLLVFSVLRLAGIAWLVACAWRQAVRRVPEPTYPLEHSLDHRRDEDRRGADSPRATGRALRVEPAAASGPNSESGRGSDSGQVAVDPLTDASALARAGEVDELAGPLAGAGDHLTVAFR